MKLLITVLSLSMLLLFSGCEKESVLPANETPSEIEAFITKHFPDQAIVQVVKDRDDLKVTYDIVLDNQISLEFDKKKEITGIEGIVRLPDSVIPSRILDYTSSNYAENYIIEWELDDKNQKVKLDSKLELEFTASGDYLRIDD